MRAFKKDGPIAVQAIAGTYVVLLGIDLKEENRAGVLGFGIQRTDHTNNGKVDWIDGFKVFKGTHVTPGTLSPTNKQPIQGFLWGDYTTRKAHRYTYRIVAMRGQPGALQESEDVSVTVDMEKENNGTCHEVYFNRGVGGSQAYVKKFGNLSPDDVGPRAFEWLSRGLLEAFDAFLMQATDSSWTIHAAVYEFNYVPALEKFKAAIDRGVGVKIVYDGREKDNGPWKSNEEALKSAKIHANNVAPRKKDKSYIAHNKFIILIRNGVPKQVWTGSMNFTRGGIFGHSNVGHIVRDEQVARSFEEYWQQLNVDPDTQDLRPWNEQHSKLPVGLPPANSVTTIFSPRSNLKALEWYAERMKKADTCSFLTAAFGVDDKFQRVLSDHTDPQVNYLLIEREDEDIQALRDNPQNRIAVGSVLQENMYERWLKERLTGFNVNVRFIHTNYLLIDPLGEDPIVISGSANFSDPSTRNNDENMLVIRGNSNVADIYLGEFMRLFMHFYFRQVANADRIVNANPDAGYLKDTDQWSDPFYTTGTRKYQERLYFVS